MHRGDNLLCIFSFRCHNRCNYCGATFLLNASFGLNNDLKAPGVQDFKERAAEDEKFGFDRKSEFNYGP